MVLDSILLSDHQIDQFCRKHNIRKLAVFGSVVRDDFSPDSDVDVLVEFESGKIPGFDFFLIEAELSDLIERKVDLQTANFLSPEFRNSVLDEAITIHEQA